MEIYIRNKSGDKRVFQTLEEAERFIKKSSKPGGNSVTIWGLDGSGKHPLASYRKMKDGSLKALRYEEGKDE